MQCRAASLENNKGQNIVFFKKAAGEGQKGIKQRHLV